MAYNLIIAGLIGYALGTLTTFAILAYILGSARARGVIFLKEDLERYGVEVVDLDEMK